MADPAKDALDDLKVAIDLEFPAADTWQVRLDRLHDSMGEDGNYIGLSVDNEREGRNANVLEVYLRVQLYGRFDPQIDNKQRVDPSTVIARAGRLRRAIGDRNGTGSVWFYRVTGVDYPEDPTGNQTRAVAFILAWAPNDAFLAA